MSDYMDAADYDPGVTAWEDDGTVWVRAWRYDEPCWTAQRWESTPHLDKSAVFRVTSPCTTWQRHTLFTDSPDHP